MNELNKLKLIGLLSVFGSSTSARPAEPASRASPDRIAGAQRRLTELRRDLGVTAQEEEQWAAFSAKVLAQIERVSAARQTAEGVPWSDPTRADRKRELIRQVIVTPGLLSQAAKDLYIVLTPEQQRVAGKRLLNFHRELLA